MGIGLGLGLSLTGTRRGGAAWTPAALFANGEAGAWYDIDPAYCFTTSTGTTQATVGDPVGLLLDRSRGLVLGSAFQPSAWTNASWDTFSADGGSFTASKDASGGTDLAHSTETVPVSLNKTYQVTVNVSATTLSAYRVQFSAGSNSRSAVASFSGTGEKVGYIVPNVADGSFSIAVLTTATGSITIDNVSVRELPGNHATQATSAARPTLRQTVGGLYYLEFDGVDDVLVSGANSGIAGGDAGTTIYAARRDSAALPALSIGTNSNGRLRAFNTRNLNKLFTSSYWTDDLDMGASDNNDHVFSIWQPVGTTATRLAQIDNGTPGSKESTSIDTLASPIRMGALTATSVYGSGRNYGGLVIDRELTSAERALAIAYFAARSGVTL